MTIKELWVYVYPEAKDIEVSDGWLIDYPEPIEEHLATPAEIAEAAGVTELRARIAELEKQLAERELEYRNQLSEAWAASDALREKMADETEGNDLLRAENESALMQLAEARATIKAQAEDASVGKAIRELPEDTYISYRNYLLIPEWESIKPWQITRFEGIDDDGEDYEGDSLIDALRAAGLLQEKVVTG